MKDKRKYKRCSIDLTARYLQEDNQKEWKGCTVVNISREGFGVQAYPREILNIGSTLQIEIVVPTKDKPIEAEGILIWVNEPKEKTDFAGGLKLAKIDAEDKWTLLDYTYDSLSIKEKLH